MCGDWNGKDDEEFYVPSKFGFYPGVIGCYCKIVSRGIRGLIGLKIFGLSV